MIFMGDVKIPSRSDWLFGGTFGIDIVSDKDALIQSYATYMLANTLQMFEYKGLPESVPQKELEILHQINRFAVWKKVNEKIYVFYAGLGGVLDEYYHPTRAVISNPYLNYSADLEIDKDCVVSWNDQCRIGLCPMFNKYATLLAETDISIKFAIQNARIPYLVGANDDNTKDSIEKVFEKIRKGDFGVILNKKLFESNNGQSMFTQEFGARNQNNIKDLIELKQYLKSSWYLELGIQSNYNMKRESLNSNETTMDESVLLPLIDDMLSQRKRDMEKVNKMFGLNITVELSSSWKKIREEIKNELEKQELESGQKEDVQKENEISDKVDENENN